MLFHDHRAHWMGSQPPAAVRDDPDVERRLADWSVPVVVDGQAGAIQGYYRYEPPPSKALWLGVLAALALAASVLVWRLRGPRRRLALWILAGAAVLPAPILGAAETLDLPDPGVDVAAGVAVYTVLIGALAAGAWWARRDPAAEAAILAVAALAVGAFALVGRLALLDHGVVPSALPAWLDARAARGRPRGHHRGRRRRRRDVARHALAGADEGRADATPAQGARGGLVAPASGRRVRRRARSR